MQQRILSISVLLLAVLACNTLQPAVATATFAAVLPTPSPSSPTATAAPALPSGSGSCLAASSSDVTIYARPSLQADIFSTIVLSTPEEITSRTADGWLGFEPGVAQAANIGVFRLRWIQAETPVALSGNCAAVPVAEWVPKPGVCYEMVMSPVEVHAAANPSSAVSATLAVGDFAAILGRTGTGWLFINGDQANRPGAVGFIPETEMNASGPCDAIPTVPG